MFLGLEYIIWIILVVYFAGMLLLGWWSDSWSDHRIAEFELRWGPSSSATGSGARILSGAFYLP